jgi:hypothetical protein
MKTILVYIYCTRYTNVVNSVFLKVLSISSISNTPNIEPTMFYFVGTLFELFKNF